MAKTAKKPANTPDLFGAAASSARRLSPKETRPKPAPAGDSGYTARDIEVLEGLEPRGVPRHVYYGTDERRCITCSPR
jgi:topoisomerase-4 subunit B